MTSTKIPDNTTYAVKRYTWLLLAACFISLFLFLDSTLFNTRGSSREAVVALTMLQDGNWVLPVNNGVDMAYKPPFLHWLMALVSLPGGHVTELTARIPSALALTVMTVAGFRFYAHRGDVTVALVAGLLTLTTFEVHRAGVGCRVDMVLTCMMVLALYQLYIWSERRFSGCPWLAVLCLSGAFLTKGPVGVALPCVVVLVYALVRHVPLRRVLPRLVGVGVLACVLPALWYVAAWQQGGSRFLRLIYEENILRLIGKMTYESHVNPWYYNVQTVLAGFLPYTLLAVMSLFVIQWRCLCRPFSQLWKCLAGRLRSMSDVRLYSLLAFAIIFVFYCIPKSKRSVYLLPVYPFLAYFLAEYVMWLRREHRRLLVSYGWVLATLALLLTALFAAIRLGLVPDSVAGGGKHAAENLTMFSALKNSSLGFLQWCAYAVPVVAVGFYVWCVRHRRRIVSGMLLLVFALTFALDGVYQPLVLNVKSDKPVAQRIARIVPSGRVYSFRSDVVPGNPMHPFTINFYLGDRVVPFDAFLPAEGWLIVGDDDITDFRRQYPAWRVVRHIDFHRRSCDDHKELHLYKFVRR